MNETFVEEILSSQLSESIEMSFGELLFYNMRHVQHDAAQLNLILRQKTDSAPRWVKRK